MRKTIHSILITSLALGLSIGLASGQEKNNRDELENRAHAVNSLADKHGGMNAALHNISIETGVPMDELQTMRNHHPDAGASGILIACVLADNTKKPPEEFLAKHIKGKGWAGIAHDNNVPLDKINERLDHLERELTPVRETEKSPERHKNQ